MSGYTWLIYRNKCLFFRTLWRYRIITDDERIALRVAVSREYDEEVHHG